MARQKRIRYHDAIYHVMSRGIAPGPLFAADGDCHHFLLVLRDAWERYHARWRFIMLMKTHYHLLLQTPLPNISEIMQYVNGRFAQAWNARRSRRGPVFDAPFTAIPVEDDFYAQTLLRYIAWNPVAAGYVEHPAQWPWSSYRATAGLESAADFLDVSWLGGFFGCPTLSTAQQAFVDCIDCGPVDDSVVNEVAIGSEAFKVFIRQEIGSSMYKRMVPRSYRALGRPTLGQLFDGIAADLDARNLMIRRAHVVHGYRLSEVARTLNLHPNTVSKILRKLNRDFHVINVK
jgi:putative transposase